MHKSSLKSILLGLCLVHMLPAGAETLSIGVSHSEYLPAVPALTARVAIPKHYQSDSLKTESAAADSSATLESGVSKATAPPPPKAPELNAAVAATATSAVAPKSPPTLEKPIIEWFPIPGLMAGVWNKRGDLTTSVTDLRTGLAQPLNQWTDDEMTVTWGHQTDKLGNIWHANLLPAERDSISAGKYVKFLTVSQKLEATNPQSLVTRTHYLVSERYGATGPVADIFQQEALNHYQLIAEGQLQNSSTNRVFAYQGQPIRDGALLTRFSRVGPFSPVPTLSGVDLVQSLNDYLRSINRLDLVR